MLVPDAEVKLRNLVRMSQLQIERAEEAFERNPCEATDQALRDAYTFAGFAGGVWDSVFDRGREYPAEVAVSRISRRSRWLLFWSSLRTLFSGRHDYVSTGCLHGDHGYCRGEVGKVGAKAPGRCKFCPASCRCGCHSSGE